MRTPGTNRVLRAALAGGAIASLSLSLSLSPCRAGEPESYARALADSAPSVVAVRFQLRPKERPKGGEGPKLKRVVCGVLAGPPGQVLITGDFFPDVDDGPEAIEPFDFRLVLPGGEEVPAEAAGVDRELNLAFLKADPTRLQRAHPAAFDSSVQAALGEEVLVIGLLSEEYGFARTFYTARINAVIDKPRRMYSLDVPIEDLAIGGLVVLRDGRPLGLVGKDLIPEGRTDQRPYNFLAVIGSDNQGPKAGYPMVYPYSVISRSVASPPSLQAESPQNRGWMGIVMQPLSKDLADYWKIPADGGVIVAAVVDDSPAALAGLRPGDVILQVDGQDLPVREAPDLPLMQKRIRAAGAGRAVPLSVWRDGRIGRFDVQLTASPVTVNTAEEFENDTFGIKVRALSYDFLQGANLDRNTRGVLVTDLERAGWAEVSGVERGDIVQKVGGEPTPDVAAFRGALEKAGHDRVRELIFFVLRDYQTQFVRVKTDWKVN